MIFTIISPPAISISSSRVIVVAIGENALSNSLPTSSSLSFGLKSFISFDTIDLTFDVFLEGCKTCKLHHQQIFHHFTTVPTKSSKV